MVKQELARCLQQAVVEAQQKGDLAAARYAGVPFVGIDPGTGEFNGEDGFDGPYKSLADWYQKV